MDLPDIPLQTRWSHPQDWYLCHRGAEPAVIAEIVAVMATQEQDVEVQEGDGLSLTFPEFREQVRAAVERKGTRVIVLLNRHFTGPIFRQTLSPIIKHYGTQLDLRCVQIETCDTEGAKVFVNLADVADQAERIKRILRLAPTAQEESL